MSIKPNQYEFFGGRVKLVCNNGRYDVLIDGIVKDCGFNDTQHHNPRLMSRVATDAVAGVMRDIVADYLSKQGWNPVMGCKRNMSCKDCIRLGLKTEDSNCMQYGISEWWEK